MQLTSKSHYNPCFWTAHWNAEFLDAVLAGNANYGVAREQTVYALNVKSNKIRESAVSDVHFDKGVGFADITPDAALDFCKRTQPNKYEECSTYFKANPQSLVLDVEAILTGLEQTAAYTTLKRVIVTGRIHNRYEKALLAGFIAVHHARSHAVLNSMMQLHRTAGIHWFESMLMLRNYLSNQDALFQHVSSYVMGYFTFYKVVDDTFPLNDSPILIKAKSIMVALSPRLLLEIDRSNTHVQHECCVKNFIPQEKLDEFRRRTIANTFREIIFGCPDLLEEWRRSPEFVGRHGLMANVKSYNKLVTKYEGREIWRINAHSEQDDNSTPFVTEKCWVLLYPGSPQELNVHNTVRIDYAGKNGRGTLVPIFTAPDLADKLLASLGDPAKGMAIFQPATLRDLQKLLEALCVAGVTDVHFNAMPPGSPSPAHVPIRDVIASLAWTNLQIE
jgi:hypothetical protein